MRHFIKQFISAPKRTGAIAPSSRHLCQLVVRTSAISKAKVVVELGSGTGVFTEGIIGSLADKALFLALEVNPIFAMATRRRCPSAIVYEDSAETIGNYLQKHGAGQCDCIISGLPWGLFDKEMQQRLLSSVTQSLSCEGEFLAFTYVGCSILPGARRFHRMLSNLFSDVKKTRTVWRNIPPAFVYHCRNKKVESNIVSVNN